MSNYRKGSLFCLSPLTSAPFESLTLLATSSLAHQTDRQLGGTDVPYDPTRDECKLGEDENGFNIYGACDATEHFPSCDPESFICYNRINRRDKFYLDKNPYFYIDPRRVLCYPNDWIDDGGCSSCTPGRYCLSENRCILEEETYNCTVWW